MEKAGVQKELESAREHFQAASNRLRSAIEKIVKDDPSFLIDLWADDFSKALKLNAPPGESQMPRSFVALDSQTTKKVLTPGRLDLMEILAGGNIKTVGELAKVAKKPLPVVSRGLKILENFGLVKLIKQGRRKKPVLLTQRISVQLERQA